MGKIPAFAAYYEPSYLLEVRLSEAVHMMALPPMLEKIFPDETYYLLPV